MSDTVTTPNRGSIDPQPSEQNWNPARQSAPPFIRIPFTLRIRDFNGYSMHVEVVDSPFGRMRQPEIVPFNPELILYLSKLGSPSLAGKLDDEELIIMGQIIGDMLFPTQVRRLFLQTIKHKYHPNNGEGIRVLLEIDDEQLTVIPWEYCYLQEFKFLREREMMESGVIEKIAELDGIEDMHGFLGLDDYLSIIRYEPYVEKLLNITPEHLTTVEPQEEMKILFCAADPFDLGELNIAGEVESIVTKIKKTNKRTEQRKLSIRPDEPVSELFDAERMEKEFDVTKEMLQKRLDEDLNSQVFHFSGHAGYISRFDVSQEGQVYDVIASQSHITEEPSDEDVEWERRITRALSRAFNSPGNGPAAGFKEGGRDIKNASNPLRDIKNASNPLRDIKNASNPLRDIKNASNPLRDIKNASNPLRGGLADGGNAPFINSSVFDPLDRKEGVLVLEKGHTTHWWQDHSFKELEDAIKEELDNTVRANLAGLKPAMPLYDFIKHVWGQIEEADNKRKADPIFSDRRNLVLYLRKYYAKRLFGGDASKVVGDLKDLFEDAKKVDSIEDFDFENIDIKNIFSLGRSKFKNKKVQIASDRLDKEVINRLRNNEEDCFNKAWKEWIFSNDFWDEMPPELKQASLRWRAGSHDILWANELSDMLRGKGIKLVLLNSCKTSQSDSRGFEAAGVATTLIQSGIPAVIGMQLSIDDDAAIEFSSTFYDTMANGHRLEEALVKGRQAMRKLATPQYWGVPTLYMRQISVADTFRLCYYK